MPCLPPVTVCAVTEFYLTHSPYTREEVEDFLLHFDTIDLPPEATTQLTYLRHNFASVFHVARDILRRWPPDGDISWEPLSRLLTPAFTRAHLEARLSQFGQPSIVDYSFPRGDFQIYLLQRVVSQREPDDSDWGGTWVHGSMRECANVHRLWRVFLT